MPEIQQLSIDERLQLVEAIWDSIAVDTSALPVDPAHLEEIRERLAAYRSDNDRGENAYDVAESIRRNL
ncbi:MAG: addiction module protein [Pseudomonadales bacterium]